MCQKYKIKNKYGHKKIVVGAVGRRNQNRNRKQERISEEKKLGGISFLLSNIYD